MFPHIIHYSARDAFTAIIVIGLGMPLATIHHTKQASLDTPGTHLAIAADGSRVPSQRAVAIVLAVTEVVLPRSVSELTVDRQAHVFVQLVLPSHARIYQAK